MERSTSAPDCVRALISAEKVTSRARAIFHRTLIVGADWPSSIWPSIARDTPESWARRSSERPRRVRSRRRFEPTTGARSVWFCGSAGAAVSLTSEPVAAGAGACVGRAARAFSTRSLLTFFALFLLHQTRTATQYTQMAGNGRGLAR